jgi:imidazolonepropionase-like amidohydrolase
VGVRHFGDVVEHVERSVAAGAAGVKLYQGFPAELVSATIAAAHAAGLRVAHHVGSGSLPAFARCPVPVTVGAGVDSVEHVHSLTAALLDSRTLAELVTDRIDSVGAAFGRVFTAWSRIDLAAAAVTGLVELLADRGTVLVPTLTTFAAMARDTSAGGIPAVFARTRTVSQATVDAGLAAMLRFVGIAAASGVGVALGTDCAVGTGLLPGDSAWDELGLLLEAGLDARAVLRAAAPYGALADRLGIGPPPDDGPLLLVRGPTLADALRAGLVELVDRARVEPWSPQGGHPLAGPGAARG